MAVTTRQRALIAVSNLLTTEGIEAVTMRHVAAEAGMSVGAVQHLFKTKESLVLAAMESVSEAFTADLMALIRDSSTAQEALQSLCFLLAGAMEEQRDAGTIWLAFVSKASTSAEIAAAHRKAWSAMEEALDELLRAIAPHADSDDAAGLLATLDGLAIARVTEPTRMPAERAERIVLRSLSGIERRSTAGDSG